MSTTYQVFLIQQNKTTIKFGINSKGKRLSFLEVFQLWEKEASFVHFYKNALIGLNFPAYYWEHPALHKDWMHKDYECIIEESSHLEHLAANELAFQDHLYIKALVADFRNLGKDARLVIPTKKSSEAIYNHLGRFIRKAENEQIEKVFHRLGTCIQEELAMDKTIWLNTAGLGVIWLHIRLDTRPKYYKTSTYRDLHYLMSVDS